jgi:hypothetical protein
MGASPSNDSFTRASAVVSKETTVVARACRGKVKSPVTEWKLNVGAPLDRRGKTVRME